MNDLYSITNNSYKLNHEDFYDKWKNSNEINSEKIDYFISLLKPGSQVLDVGAGFGKDVFYFNSKGLRSIGVDNCREFIKKGKKNYGNIEIIETDFLSMEFDENTFDGVWSRGSLFHISKYDFSKVIEMIRHYSKNNSVFYILMKEGNTELVQNIGSSEYKGYYALYEEKELEEIFSRNGYTIIKNESKDNWISHFYRLKK